MDYSVWASLEQVFCTKIRNLEHLEEELNEAWKSIEQSEIDNIIQTFRKRVNACIAIDGGRFEYLLK